MATSSVDDLKKIFGCKEDQALGAILGRKKGAVSVWRKRGIPASIQLKVESMVALSKDDKVPSSLTDMATLCSSLDSASGIMILTLLQNLKEMEKEDRWALITKWLTGLKP